MFAVSIMSSLLFLDTVYVNPLFSVHVVLLATCACADITYTRTRTHTRTHTVHVLFQRQRQRKRQIIRLFWFSQVSATARAEHSQTLELRSLPGPCTSVAGAQSMSHPLLPPRALHWVAGPSP